MRKRLLILSACGLCTGLLSTARAESPEPAVKPVIVVNAADGATSVPVDQVKQITFEGNDMVLLHNDGTLRKSIDDITDIKFDFASSAVESVSKDFEDDFSVSFDHGVMTVTPAGDKEVRLAVYTLQGVAAIPESHISDSHTVDLNVLDRGVYIIVINNKTIKFTH